MLEQCGGQEKAEEVDLSQLVYGELYGEREMQGVLKQEQLYTEN